MSAGTRVLLIMVGLLGLLVLMRLLDPQLAPSLIDMVGSDALKTLNSPWFHLGTKSGQQAAPGLDVTPILIIQTVIFIVLLTVGARMGRRFLHMRILSRTHLDVGQRYALANIFGYILFVFGLMIGLQTAGLDLSSLTVLGGAVGIGIGFGLQGIANNFISGLILLIERPIKIGDRVELGTTVGDVMRIGTRSTWIRSSTNAVVIVPNSDFITGRVTNWTAIEQRGRFVVSVAVALDSDSDQVRALLMGVARSHPELQQDPAPDVILTSIAEGAIRFELSVWIARQSLAARIGSDLYLGILKTLREHGVEIALPQRDLHIRSVPENFARGL